MTTGQVHGLVLMLIAANVLELSLADTAEAGSKNLKVKDIMISLSKVTIEGDDGEYEQLALHSEETWNGFHFR